MNNMMGKKERRTKKRFALFSTEKEGFEPSRRVTDLLVFEARPFSHLVLLQNKT